MLGTITKWGAQSEGRGNLLVLLIVVALILLVGTTTIVLAQLMLPAAMKPF